MSMDLSAAAEAKIRIATLERELQAAITAKADAQRKTRNHLEAMKTLVAERDKAVATLDTILAIDAAQPTAPTWTRAKRGERAHHGIVCGLLSDTHFDEVVDPKAIEGYNAYDRRIAELRLKRWAEKFVTIPREYLTGIDYQGAVVGVNGDIITGTIHEELDRTNDAQVGDTIVHWTEQLEAALGLIADEFDGRLAVYLTDGNHDRLYKKIPMKARARGSLAWIIYHFATRSLRQRGIHVEIAEGRALSYDLYGHTYLQTHGDQGFSGGNGIAGIFSALKLGEHRATRKRAILGKPFDTLLLGHFHQYVTLPQIIVNGSLKGYDEYADAKNYPPEPPRQALWVTTPQHGPTFHAPILVGDKKAEQWGRVRTP